MAIEFEPLQQPIRKVVGRPATLSQRFVRPEELIAFCQKFAHEALARTEPDYFTLRKIVGQTGTRRR